MSLIILTFNVATGARLRYTLGIGALESVSEVHQRKVRYINYIHTVCATNK